MNKLVPVALASSVVLAGCADQLAGAPSTGEATQAILGGSPDVTGYPAVAALETLPPATMENPQPQPIFCTGTLVGEAIVLTSARCVYDLEEDQPYPLANIDLRFGASFADGEQIDVVHVETYRYYGGDVGAVHEIALVQLSSAPSGVSPVPVNAEPLDPTLDAATLVGFGATLAGNEPLKQRYKLEGAPVNSVGPRNISVGNAEATTCKGDSGGPVFADLGAGEVLIAMTELQGDCSANVTRIRVDLYAAEFIHAFIDREEGPCRFDGTECVMDGCRTPDPDCDASGCAWEGEGGACVEDCPTRDWDCPLGTFVGDACELSGECENGGRCVAALDDPSFTYCSQPCATDEDCPAERGMTCVDDGDGGKECQHGVPSEGSQGYACTSEVQCRSGICEDQICVTECDPAAADACPEPFVCGPSEEVPGTNVCLGEDLDGGGGFCAIGGVSERRRAAPGWIWLVLAGLGIAGLRGRRAGGLV